MKVLNFGSMNIDYVYQVEHFIQAGETLGSLSMQTHCGGKGLNQSIALAKAGIYVYHAGMIGQGGRILKDRLEANLVNVSLLCPSETTAGHAIIQVNQQGQNCILLYGGANQVLEKDYIDEVLGHFGKDDIVLIQNETNEIPYIMQRAKSKGLRLMFNPSPMSADLKKFPLDCVNWLILNEIEGEAISGQKDSQKIVQELVNRYPNTTVVLTLGEKGVICKSANATDSFGVFPVNVVDTTAAGDTFTGYFLSGVVKGMSIHDTLVQATAASSLAVSKNGAADSIPTLSETVSFLKSHNINLGA